MSRLLLEIGTEAIPAGYLPPALSAMAEGTGAALAEARLSSARVRSRGTARRLVLEVEDLADRQPDRVREVQGPRVDAAFRDGKPTPAAEGFARKNGVRVEELERVGTEKGEFLLARIPERGLPVTEILPDLLLGVVRSLPWPKTMRWEGSDLRFPRPVRWVLCLLDGEVLPLTLAGLTAGRATRGHRLVQPSPVEVRRPADLDGLLAGAGVMLDPDRRREAVRKGLVEGAAKLRGKVVEDPVLLEEVIFLAEHPTVLAGSFDPEFLALPREIVVTAMRSHQRYFAVEDEQGNLLPRFLCVADGTWKDASPVIAGNERVLRARLADARFYWDVDRKTGLDALASHLDRVVWLESVGTLAEKSERVSKLVERLGSDWYAKEWSGLRSPAARAARLAKADLASEMIKDGKEFTGLQGLVGARYAEEAGESEVVSRALAEQYLPRGARDPLPRTPVGTVLAFGDRLDTLAGCWAAGFVPSGSQDPYGLRRAANGLVRILLEGGHHVSLRELVGEAVAGLPAPVRGEGLEGELLGFLRDRIAFFLREEGIVHDVVESVLASDADDPVDARARARALSAIREEEDLGRLVIGFKRAANILKGIDPASLPDLAARDLRGAEPAERELHERAAAVRAQSETIRARKDYPALLQLLLGLRAPIDRFFDDVLVMSEDETEKGRRLAILAEVRDLFHHAFDPTKIVLPRGGLITGRAGADHPTGRVAILYPGDRETRRGATPANNRFSEVFRALAGLGLRAEPAVYHDEFREEVRGQLLLVDAVLVWMNPIQDGRDRSLLDSLLREVAEAGVFVSAHPDVIRKMGTKEVLYRTRDLGWGSDTHLLQRVEDIRRELPARLSRGPRVLKQLRGNGGIGVWKVEWAEPADGGCGPELSAKVKVREATRGTREEEIPLSLFIARSEEYFRADGRMIDQVYQPRLPEGMVRCYLVHDRVAGFGHQAINALYPAAPGTPPGEAPEPGPRLYHPATLDRFQTLKRKLEEDWVPAMQEVLSIETARLPVLWDADFLLGPRTESGEDTYVLCEINVSSVAPFPDSAVLPVAEAVLARIPPGAGSPEMRIRVAGAGDVDRLVEMMGEFYAETATPLYADRMRGGFERLVREPALGRVWILEENGTAAGYVVLTLGFSMEFGGPDAFVDDLFLRPAHRGRGLGRAALEAVLAECRRRGVRALHLEVARDNAVARALYRKFGFVDHDRMLMTREVDPGEPV